MFWSFDLWCFQSVWSAANMISSAYKDFPEILQKCSFMVTKSASKGSELRILTHMSPTARSAKSNSPEQNEINVTLRELHRFASYSQDHGNVDIRSFSIWSPMYTPCNLEIQPGQASETGKCDPRHEIWDRILLVTFWQNVVFLDPEGKVT